MPDLRKIRIFLAVLFFATALAWLVAGNALHPTLRTVREIQIMPSLLASTMGVTLFWLAITFLFGRIYCSTVCPIGTFQDIVIRLRNRSTRLRRPFSFRKPGKARYHILAVYLICLIVGVAAIPLWIEPWNMMQNICIVFNPSQNALPWIDLGLGLGAGITAGIISAGLLAVCAFFTGRGFCTEICPIGTAMGAIADYTLFHIEIDPDKCVNCLKCEEVCKSQCVHVATRTVQNDRCVRCFDCLDACPNNAIRFQINNNRRATPLVNNVGSK